MNWISLVALYFIIWWLCLFVMLPIGVRSQHESGEVAPGSERGAPARPMLLIKLAGTTVLAAVLLALVWWALSNPALREYWR